MQQVKPKTHILPAIIIAQFLCTSLWFAGNAIITNLPLKANHNEAFLGYLLSSVQFGFITGTLIFALFMIADRYRPSKVFLLSALLAATCNLALLIPLNSIGYLLLARFGTGFFLAGIYPVGMKIAADYFDKGLGKALGYLVGALVLGTAFPHFIKGFNFGDYTTVIKTTSILALLGGLIIYLLVPNGPFRQKNKKLQLKAGVQLFKISAFKKAAFGYFGHMWELYAFWAFIPFALKNYSRLYNELFSISLWSFVIIAMGCISCIIGGYFSQQVGNKKVALVSLSLSGIFCLVSPLLFNLSLPLFLGLLCIWGMVVASDSPQFSTLIATATPSNLKGTAFTLINCIGFAISIISIQLLSYISEKINPTIIFMILALGPIIGVVNLRKKLVVNN